MDLCRLLGALVFVAALSCSSSGGPVASASGDAAAQTTYGWAECPGGKTEGGGECGIPVTPCGAGSAFFSGDSACTPVGPASCAAGFEPHPSGWGCRPVAPSGACSGATFERLGDAACVALDDCAAAFPPVAATLFVDSHFTAGQVDATHKQRIADALAVAPSGAVIAIDAGEYDEALAPTKPVTLAGRCAEKVVLRGISPGKIGVSATGTRGIAVSGITITGFEPGVSLAGGAEVVLDHVIVEGNTKSGVLAADSGTRITVQGSTLRKNLPDASARFGYGLAVAFGAEAVVLGSAFTDNGEMGIFAQKSAKATVTRSIVRRSKPRAGNNAYGWGIGAQSGAALDVSETAIEDVAGGGVVAVEAGSSARVTRVFTSATRAGAVASGLPIAGGLLVQLSASATVTDSTFADAEVAGILVSDKATATVDGSAVLGVRSGDTGVAGLVVTTGARLTARTTVVAKSAQAGVVVSTTGELDGDALLLVENTGSALSVQGKATLTRLRATATQLGHAPGLSFGVGVYASTGGTIDLDRAVVEQAPGIGVLSSGAGASVTLHRTIVRDTVAPEDMSGFGLVVAEGGRAAVETSAFIGNSDISVHVTDADSACTLTDTTISATRANGPEGRGRGVNAQTGAHAELRRVAVLGSTQIGVDVSDGADLLFEDSIVDGVAKSVNGFGHGVTAVLQGIITVRRSRVQNAAAVGLVFASGAGAVVASSVIEGNAVGIYTQDGTSLAEADSEPGAAAGGEAIVTRDTQFLDNQTKVGSTILPLPSPIGKSF